MITATYVISRPIMHNGLRAIERSPALVAAPEARQSRYRLQSRYRAANSGNKLFRSNGGGYTATGHAVLF